MSNTNIKNQFKELGGAIKSGVQNSMGINVSNGTSPVYIIMALIIVAAIIFLVVSWIFYTLNKKSAACNKLDKIYLDNSKHKTNSFLTIQGNVKSNAKQNGSPVNFFDNENTSLIKNYYIKTAYNACCGDGYKNNFVNMCALEKCIQLGARCLDFEIYSYNGEPIVAASTANNNSIKETYNYIKLYDVLQLLNSKCFDETYTSCSNDPMFLHFRIMSENKVIYDKFGDYIKEYMIEDRNNLVDYEKFNYKNSNQDGLLQSHIAGGQFNNKFVIMVNTMHVPILDTSRLAKYVHLRSGSSTMRLLRYENLVAAGKTNPLMVDESHRSLSIVLPNVDNSLDNHDPLLAFSNGCQFVGMKFQNLDSNLLGYYKMFKDNGGFSFVLKPSDLRRDIIESEPIATGVILNTPSQVSLSFDQ
jgi:hypothetical protein|tara:strand:+ start:1907 stop:3151 length:1245 start_codon:yes stop_codon:yes gene_type:complete